MYAVECAVCHGRFQAKRQTARYCSDRCRKRRQRAGMSADEIAALPVRREGPQLVALPSTPAVADDEGFAAETRRELELAGRFDSYLGRSAMYLARVLDSSPGDTGGGHAALIREYKASMAAALDGVQAEETTGERLRRKRAERIGAA